MREINEADWKVLRRVHPLALERFCERVLAEIDRVSRDGTKSHHARYLQMFRILKQSDRDIARLLDNPRCSDALRMLAQIRLQDLLTEDEFSSLSPETRGAISNAARPRIKLHMAARCLCSTSTVIHSNYLVPWLAAEGPLACTPTKLPVKDYFFFQYTWILPGIFNSQVNLREHR